MSPNLSSQCYQGGGYGGGGFSAPGGARPPPPGADPQLWNWFSAVDTDKSGMITAPELGVWCLTFLVLETVLTESFVREGFDQWRLDS